jgi:hypothetical protein
LQAELLDENGAWLHAQDEIILCFQTPQHTVLIDSCIGNDKARPNRAF